MQHKLTLTLVVGLLTAIPSLASAAPSPANGSMTRDAYAVLSTSTNNSAVTTYFYESISWSGNINGVAAMHGACKEQNGRTTCRTDGTFSGTVNGVAGSFSVDESTDVDLSTGSYSGRLHIGSGSGGLSGLGGHGTISGSGASGTYALSLT